MSDFMPGKKTITKWWIFGLALVILAVVVFTVLGYAGIIFETKVERKVFEESYQYQAGKKQKIATLEAQLAEIESQLSDPKLPSDVERQLKTQRAAIRVQLRAAKQQ